MVMPRRFSSSSRSGSMPVSAWMSVDLPWSMCPAVPTTKLMSRDPSPPAGEVAEGRRGGSIVFLCSSRLAGSVAGGRGVRTGVSLGEKEEDDSSPPPCPPPRGGRDLGGGSPGHGRYGRLDGVLELVVLAPQP